MGIQHCRAIFFVQPVPWLSERAVASYADGICSVEFSAELVPIANALSTRDRAFYSERACFAEGLCYYSVGGVGFERKMIHSYIE